MGIPNVCMVRFTGTPLPPFDDYVKQFARAKRLTWSFVDGARNYTTERKKAAGAGTGREIAQPRGAGYG